MPRSGQWQDPAFNWNRYTTIPRRRFQSLPSDIAVASAHTTRSSASDPGHSRPFLSQVKQAIVKILNRVPLLRLHTARGQPLQDHRCSSPASSSFIATVGAMDGIAEERHRTAWREPLCSAPIYADKGDVEVSNFMALPRERSLLDNVQRKRSVRFEGITSDQSDNVLEIQPEQQHSNHRANQPSVERCYEALKATETLKYINGYLHSGTVVHRPHLKVRQASSDGFSEVDESYCPFFVAYEVSNSDNFSEAWTRNGQGSSQPLTRPVSTAVPLEEAPKAHHILNGKALSTCNNDSSVSASTNNGLASIKENRGGCIVLPVLGNDCENQFSLATIENAALAKFALETHFQSLLFTRVSPRSVRRTRYEQQLRDSGMSCVDRTEAYKAWIDAESEHLRQTRVLKASSMVRRNLKGTSIAGFDNVRIVGKGSFGTVHLVVDKSSTNANSESPANRTSDHSTDCYNSSAKHTSRIQADKLAPKDQQTTPNLYAMKVIRKSKMLRRCQEGHLRAERDFLVGAEGSRWIVPLVCSFQDNTNLYLVMEYMIGGDFLGLLLREDVLDEPVARWYVAEMILCIEEMHKLRWIHRDVKPDNFLISASGHLKLSDFGLAFDGSWAHSQSYYRNHRNSLLEKVNTDIIGDSQDITEDLQAQTAEPSRVSIGSQADRNDDEEQAARGEGLLAWRNRVQRRNLAKSVVGTSQYMAPEVIQEEAYDGRCDWWSIGIILYECLYGSTPFFAEDRQKTKERIVAYKTNLHFPDEARCSRPGSGSSRLLPAPSDTAVGLIRSILQCKERRLCTRRYQHAETRPGRRLSTVSHAHRSLVRHVFPNDAEEIKSHEFFRGIPWSQLHTMQPPFVPLVKENQPVTKYFESEKDIVSSDSASSTDCDATVHGRRNGKLGADGRENEKFQLGLEACLDSELGRIKEHLGSDFEKWRAERMVEVAEKRLQLGVDNGLRRKGKDKKRPLDKVLRDPVVGKEAMELRKKGAFFGYTYRRPIPPSLPRGRVEGNGHADPTTMPIRSNGLLTDEQKERGLS